MSIIYMDESGDLGFDFSKEGTSKHFLITFLFCKNHRPIEKCVRKIHKSLRKVERKVSVLHANKERPTTRRRLLQCIIEHNAVFMIIKLNKHKVYSVLQNEKQVLYNYVTNILIDRIISKKLIPFDKKTKIIASQRETNRFLNENFKSYLEKKSSVNIQVEIKTPSKSKGLQAVDFVSWAIFRKLEFGDNSYYKIIEKNIKEENSLFP